MVAPQFVAGLPIAADTCQNTRMRFTKVIRRLLIVTAMLGIIGSPMSIAVADSVMAASEAPAMEAMSDMDMSGDPPCCQDQLPSKPDCGSKSCPLVLVCTTVIVGQTGTLYSWSLNADWFVHRFLVPPQAELASSLVDPPARPPRLSS